MKYRSNNRSTPVAWRALLASAATAGLFSLMPLAPAAAQSGAAAGTGSEGLDIVVTGSRIRSPVLESPSPLSVVTADAIQNTGSMNVQDVLQQQPAVGIPGMSRVTGGNDTNPGLATVNLRNLGADRTLVLIDGRRVVAGVPGTSQVDLTMIPAPFVERVDVLTGGASAVYGSDAIAGVVNFIYKKNFSGLDLNAQEGVSKYSDDWRFTLNGTFGSNFADDRGNVMVYLGYNREGAVGNLKRARTANSYLSKGFLERVGGNNDANLQAAKDLMTPAYSPSNVGPGGIFNFGGSGGRIIDPDGTFRPYDVATDGFNAAPYGQIASPSKQITVASRFNYDVTDKINVFMESTFVNYRTEGKREASPMRTDSTLGAFTGTGGFYPIQFQVADPVNGGTVILDNPLVPPAVFAAADNRADNDAIGSKDMSFLIRTTMFPPGTRSTPTERDNFRLALGGSIDLGGSWTADAYYQYGFAKQNQSMTGLANLYRLAEAVQVVPDVFDYNHNGNTTEPICVDANARAQGCVPIDVYGLNPDGSSRISQAAVDYLITEMSRASKQEMQVGAINLTGTVFRLPAGPLQVSVGGEYRRESSKDDFDPLTNEARNGYVQLLDTQGSFNVKEAYGELVAPLLADLPMIHNLTFRAAARASDYSTVGSFYAWNLGGEWAPVPDIRFRTVYAHAVRAPNIGELFAASAAGIVTITDPCQGVTATQTGSTAENCRADPSVLANMNENGGAFSLSFSDSQGVGSITASNPSIHEEVGKTLTFGAVINPQSIAALSGLTLTADYFNINLTGAINRLSPAVILNKCYRDGLADFCQFITRRQQASGAFSVGSVEQIVRGLLNTGGAYTRGLDFTLSYADHLLGGRINIAANWTHLLKNGVVPVTGDPYDNTMGEIGSPRNVGNLNINWNNDQFGLTLNNQYIGGQMLDYENYQTTFRLADGSIPDRKFFSVGSKIYTDAQIRYTGIEHVEIYVGANNLFNVQQPPLYGGPPMPNVNGIWDPIGRRYYAGARLKF